MDNATELAARHFEGLREFLGPQVTKENPSASLTRASAREKLTRLTKQQFLELATDVYDEMNRRQTQAGSVPFLPVRDDYHPKRNQARQKLATLQPNRFADLASDVYFEIERRYPSVKQAFETQVATPPRYEEPRSQKSSRAEPNVAKTKTSSEDLSHLNFSSLDNLMADLGNMLAHNTKADDLRGPGSAVSSEEAEKLKAEYESRMENMQRRIHSLEDEVQISESKLRRVRELEEQLSSNQRRNEELNGDFARFRSEHEQLKRNYESLQDDYQQQQQIANDIRTEAANLLEEVKNLNAKNAELLSGKDSDSQKIRDLSSEIERLKHGGAANPGIPASRSIPPSSVSNDRESKASSNKETMPAESEGVISRGRVMAYQNAVDDLLRAARSDAPTNVLVAMKSIVIACKNITEDTENYENSTDRLTNDERDDISDIKNTLSTSLTSLMTAAKTHATSFGNSPLSTLENAANQLTDTIGNLVRSLQNKRGNVSSGVRESGGDSMKGQKDTRGDAFEIDELKTFLEKQTDLIVQAIQSLLQAMRQSQTFGDDFKNTINGITSIVDNLVIVSQKTLSRPLASSFRSRGEVILSDLTGANDKLETLGVDMIESPQSKTLKQKLASASYEIAKHVKELISLLE